MRRDLYTLLRTVLGLQWALNIVTIRSGGRVAGLTPPVFWHCGSFSPGLGCLLHFPPSVLGSAFSKRSYSEHCLFTLAFSHHNLFVLRDVIVLIVRYFIRRRSCLCELIGVFICLWAVFSSRCVSVPWHLLSCLSLCLYQKWSFSDYCFLFPPCTWGGAKMETDRCSYLPARTVWVEWRPPWWGEGYGSQRNKCRFLVPKASAWGSFLGAALI